MKEVFQLLIGIVFLFLGWPIGNFLAKITKEELKTGKPYFLAIILLCLLGGVVSLIFKQDILMFSLFFIAIVTSRSLGNR